MSITIKALRLSNFRCFQKAEVHFAPITLLTGANSSGKTSLIYSILCTTQTSYPDIFPFTIAPNGELCNLGGYHQIVFAKNVHNKISIGFDIETFQGPQPLPIKIDSTFYFNEKKHQMKLADSKIELLGICLTINFDHSKNKYSLDFNVTKESASLDQRVQLSKRLQEEISRIAQLLIKDEKQKQELQDSLLYTQERKLLLESSTDVLNHTSLLNSLRRNPYAMIQLHELQQTHNKMRNSVQFLGPARFYPDRIYQDKSATFTRVGSLGENFVNILLNWKESRSKKLRELIDVARSLNLVTRLLTLKVRDGLIQLRVKTSAKSPLSSIMDVGFGVSQLLPILVADIALEKAGTLLVSQPELHLHPSAQAALANYFVRRFKSHQRKYVIETHSEYLLNRFRLLVAKGQIPPNEIVIYHMTPENGSFTPRPIKISNDGSLINAPQDYFDTYRTDVLDIALGE